MKFISGVLFSVVFGSLVAQARPIQTRADQIDGAVISSERMNTERLIQLFQDSPTYAAECFVADFDFSLSKGDESTQKAEKIFWSGYSGGLNLPGQNINFTTIVKGDIKFDFQKDAAGNLGLKATIHLKDGQGEDLKAIPASPAPLSCVFDPERRCQTIIGEFPLATTQKPEEVMNGETMKGHSFNHVETSSEFDLHQVNAQEGSLILRIGIHQAAWQIITQGMMNVENKAPGSMENYLSRYDCNLIAPSK